MKASFHTAPQGISPLCPRHAQGGVGWGGGEKWDIHIHQLVFPWVVGWMLAFTCSPNRSVDEQGIHIWLVIGHIFMALGNLNIWLHSVVLPQCLGISLAFTLTLSECSIPTMPGGGIRVRVKFSIPSYPEQPVVWEEKFALDQSFCYFRFPGLELPKDLCCSFRIHDGQRLVSPGLIGSMLISNHYQSESLLDLNTSTSGLTNKEGMKNCLPVSFCVNTGNGQFVALTDQEGYKRGEVFWPSPDRSIDNQEIRPAKVHQFSSAKCFSDWLCQYADQLSKNYYPIIGGEIYKFVFSSSCTTQGITVCTTTAFLPELSSVNPPLFFFTYRISISMDPECSVVSFTINLIGTLSKWGWQGQHQEAREIFLCNPDILLSIFLVYPVCFYFHWNSVDSSISSWTEQWALVLGISATFWRQCRNGAVEVLFESRTAQMSALFQIFTFTSCLL